MVRRAGLSGGIWQRKERFQEEWQKLLSCTLHRVLLPVSPGRTEPVLAPIYSLTLCLDDDSSGRCVLNLLLLGAFLGT